MSLGFARPEKHNTAALAWARHIWFNPRLPGTPPKAGALCCDWWCLFFVLMTGRGKVSLGFARPEKHHAELSWARHIWFNPRLPGTPPKAGALCCDWQGGRCRWALLDQRGTTPHRRGPGISGSTQGYLALPPRQELYVATGKGKVSLGFARPERHHAAPAWARHI